MTTTQHTKIRIKSATFELEFEGREHFVSQELLKLAENLASIKFSGENLSIPAKPNEENFIKKQNQNYKSTADIAAKLKVNSGRDLVIAAMAKLHFVDDQEANERKTILAEMKTAKAYYNNNYSASLSNSFKSLQKNQRILTSGSHYSLAKDEIDSLAKKLP